MRRDEMFILPDGAPSTFAYDDQLPPLPLPTLDSTLERYYESLTPFGTDEELRNSKKLIDEFKSDVGPKLQDILLELARTQRNWVEKLWEDYGYCTIRYPILPFVTMTSAFIGGILNILETSEYALKLTARNVHHTLEYWDLIRKEKLKPTKNPSSSTTFTSYFLKRLFSTSRLPGVEMDEIVSHFKTITEGSTPEHMIVIGRGRVFKVHCLNADGSILSPQQLLPIFQQIRDSISGSDVNLAVPALTGDNRTAWAKNRNHLKTLSKNNENNLKIINESILTLVLDENCPQGLSEVQANIIAGDNHSVWQDKSWTIFTFSNGKLGFCGEHTCVDGMVLSTLGRFIMMSLIEFTEPQWDQVVLTNVAIELKFDLDVYLVSEINRVMQNHKLNRNCVLVSAIPYTGYGLHFLKAHLLPTDAYIQMILQLTYYKMHKTLAAVYEPAQMAQFYNGRTEAVRACTMDSIKWVKTFMDDLQTNENKFKCLKNAINTHNLIMEAARKGDGINRHLFGLWCAAFESKMEIPKLYHDVLYKRSGNDGTGAILGSFVGFSATLGCVPPLCLDGYTIAYSITRDAIIFNVSVFRNSHHTSAHRFSESLEETMQEVKNLIVKVVPTKL